MSGMKDKATSRLFECDLPALSAILPDLMLAKLGDPKADLDAAMQVVSFAIANPREAQRELFG